MATKEAPAGAGAPAEPTPSAAASAAPPPPAAPAAAPSVDFKEVPLKTSPEYSASFLSQFLFIWMGPLFTLGNSRQLQQDDLLGIAGEDDPKRVSAQFESGLAAEIAAGSAEPVKAALVKQFKGAMLMAGLVKVFNSTLQFAPSLLLYGLLSSLQQGRGSMFPSTPTWSGYVFAAAMFVAMALRTAVENKYFHMVIRVGYQIRIALSTGASAVPGAPRIRAAWRCTRGAGGGRGEGAVVCY